MESALLDKGSDVRLKSVIDKIRARVASALSQQLHSFQDLVVNIGLGSLYNASMLIDLSTVEEPAVIDEQVGA